MQFHTLSIFLHRPYFSRDLLEYSQSTPVAGSTRPEAVRSACVSAAHSLVEILQLYRQQHTLRHTNVQTVHLIFTASLIHIYNACTSPPSSRKIATDDLRFCCQALGEIGQCYRNATRALEVIINVKREWQNLAATRTAASTLKRFSHSVIDDGEAEDHERRRKRVMSSSTNHDMQQVQMPASLETIRDSAADISLQSVDVYDAWQFLNWTELGMDLTAGDLEGGGGLDGV
jgi:hypothetical protein